jgi:SAM-dependent methyltransferase
MLRLTLRLALLGFIVLLAFQLHRVASVDVGRWAPVAPSQKVAGGTSSLASEDHFLSKFEERIVRSKGQELTSPEALEELLASLRARPVHADGKGHQDDRLTQKLYANWLSSPLREDFLRHLNYRPQSLSSDRHSRLIRDYVNELGSEWVVEVARALQGQDTARLLELSRHGTCPERLLRCDAPGSGGRDRNAPEVDRTTGIHRLRSGFFDENRAQAIAQCAIAAAPGSLEGKTICDMGTSVGAPLAWYEQAVGPKGQVYAVDIDSYSLDFVRFCVERGHLSRTKVVPGKADDCMLPAETMDCFILTDVHMGSGFEPERTYRTSTLPWLRSMSTALRPGGYLIVDEGQPFNREQVCEAFKSVNLVMTKWEQSRDYNPDPASFVAVFRKK